MGWPSCRRARPPTTRTTRAPDFPAYDPGAETSFAVETSGPLFEPVDSPFEKSDGQRLVEALGIRHKLFQRIQHADRGDFREALHINRALWSETLGYYLEEMLDLDLNRIGRCAPSSQITSPAAGCCPLSGWGHNPMVSCSPAISRRWKWSEAVDGEEFPELEDVHATLQKVEKILAGLIPKVARTNAPGDPFQNLLYTLGLQASSVDFYRRYAAGLEYVWNYLAFTPGTFQGQKMVDILANLAQSLATQLETDQTNLPSIFRLSFFQRQDQIRDPLVDDIAADEVEKLSETKKLRAIYQVPDPANPRRSYGGGLHRLDSFQPLFSAQDPKFRGYGGRGIAHPAPAALPYAARFPAAGCS